MRITERQLRSIVNEEISRSRVIKEGAVESGKTTAQWLKDTGVQANYTARYKDQPYFVLDDAARGPGAYRTGFGDPFTYEDVGGGKIKVVTGPEAKSIGKIIPKSGSLIPTAGGGQAPVAQPGGSQCNLASYQASLTQQLKSVVKVELGVAAYVQTILFGKYSNIAGDTFISVGNSISSFGKQFNSGGGIWSAVKSAGAWAADAAMGPLNEMAGAALVLFGTFMKGVQAAIAGFGTDCNWAKFKAAVSGAWSSAYSTAKASFNQNFDSGLLTRILTAAVQAGLALAGLAVGAIVAIVAATIQLVKLGAQAIGTVLQNVGAAIVGAGQTVAGAGTAVKTAAGAPPPAAAPVSESVRRRRQREFDQVIREAVEVARIRNRVNRLSPHAQRLLRA